MTAEEKTSQPLKLEYSRSKTFEVAVISTMSSGKSTLINALIGAELLPAQNQACTNRATAVLDNDEAQSVTGHVLLSNGQYKKADNCTAAQIHDYLNEKNDQIADIIIECSIPGICNAGRALMIVDTPGTNNSADLNHEAITKNYLAGMSDGLIVYILNATQIGTNDDLGLLLEIKQVLDKNPALDILFLLNKADELDPEKRPLMQTMQYCYAYLCEKGLSNSPLLPVSSAAALCFKKVINGHPLTLKEKSDFMEYFEQFSSSELQLPAYALFPEAQRGRQIYEVGGKTYSRAEILAALDNTGLPAVERTIEGYIIRRIISCAPQIHKPEITPPNQVKTAAFPWAHAIYFSKNQEKERKVTDCAGCLD